MGDTNGLLPPRISIATSEDISALTQAINSAFRGDGGKNDWNNCHSVIQDKPRTSDELITKYMSKENSVFIKYTCEDGVIGGCLFLEDTGESNGEIWLVGVTPEKQNQGIGKKLMNGTVIYAQNKDFKHLKLTTPTDRPDVVSWYERCGFTNTGKTVLLNWLMYMPNYNGVDEILCEESILTMDL